MVSLRARQLSARYPTAVGDTPTAVADTPTAVADTRQLSPTGDLPKRATDSCRGDGGRRLGRDSQRGGGSHRPRHTKDFVLSRVVKGSNVSVPAMALRASLLYDAAGESRPTAGCRGREDGRHRSDSPRQLLFPFEATLERRTCRRHCRACRRQCRTCRRQCRSGGRQLSRP